MVESARAEASILHVDMDSFFVSVELLDRPEFIGLPVAVANESGRSVVSSASYEARKFGVSSAMPAVRARQLCPQLIFIPPSFTKYRDASRKVMAVFAEFTPLVEPLSIDEAFLDVRGALRLFGSPANIARELRTRVREQTGLPASVGLAGNKFVAKLASQRAKPDGILEIPPERTLDFLHPLPIEAMWGVGAATARSLHNRAIRTVGDLAAEPLESLRRIVGASSAARLHELAWGRDTRSVETRRVEKSVGHEETFDVDQTDVTLLERELLRLSSRTAERLRAHDSEARTIAIKVRWSDFTTVTRSRTLPEATNTTDRIYRTARELLLSLGDRLPPVRLIGVRAEQLQSSGSDALGLWSDEDSWRAVDQAADSVRRRFGSDQLTSARLLPGASERARGDVTGQKTSNGPQPFGRD